VPELRANHVAVVTCVGEPEAVDAVVALPFATPCRIAPDEAMLLITFAFAAEFMDRASEVAIAIDPQAIVLDTSDGWTGWSLVGPDVRRAFERLSAIPLAPGFSQGDVAHVPVKILASEERIDLFVPAMWSDHLRERILARCDDVTMEAAAP
jgi:hypothetical protein